MARCLPKKSAENRGVLLPLVCIRDQRHLVGYSYPLRDGTIQRARPPLVFNKITPPGYDRSP